LIVFSGSGAAGSVNPCKVGSVVASAPMFPPAPI
jgi:hypothetical protein